MIRITQTLVTLGLLVVAALGHRGFDFDSSYEYLAPASRLLPDADISNYEWKNIRERMTEAEKISEVPIVTEEKLKVAGGSDKGNLRFKPNGQPTKVPQKPKVDTLPKYCDPPNPCPTGRTEADGCQSNVEDTETFNRQWILKKQANGECPCDREHMKSCEGRRTVSSGVELNEPIVKEINKLFRNVLTEDDSDDSSESADDEQAMEIQIPEDAKVVAKKGMNVLDVDNGDESDVDMSDSDEDRP